jgi:ribosomal-protein-alanine N-acetyltransferase
LETERLYFREWTKNDLDFFAEMNKSPKVMKHFLKPLSDEESALFLERIQHHFDHHGYGLYAACLKTNGQPIGFIGFQITTFKAFFTPCVEIGWRLHEDYWKQGYAVEGAKALLDYGFSHLGFERVYSFTSTTNQASQKVMERIGLEYQRTFDHPNIEEGHPLQKHVLFMKERNNGVSDR